MRAPRKLKKPSKAADEVEQAKEKAAALLAAAEAAAKRKRKRENEATTKDLTESEKVGKAVKELEGSKEVAATTAKAFADMTEGELNGACSRAKAAHLAAPADEALAAAYTAAKQAFSAMQRTKPSVVQAKAAAAKAHQDRVAAVAMYECRLCSCTCAASAQATHEAGARHLSKVRSLKELWRDKVLKKGDWICTQHGWHVAANFASKSQCRRTGCEASKEEGLSFEEAAQLVRSAPRGEPGKSRAVSHEQQEAPSHEPVVASDSAIAELSCRDCSQPFAFAVREQQFYEAKGYALPTRCIECRAKKRQRVADEAK